MKTGRPLSSAFHAEDTHRQRAGLSLTCSGQAMPQCNWHRPHGSLGASPPISRAGLDRNDLLTLHTQVTPPKLESSASQIFRHSGMTVAFKTRFEVFTRVGPDNALERLAERSVGLVTDQPGNVDELFVTLLE